MIAWLLILVMGWASNIVAHATCLLGTATAVARRPGTVPPHGRTVAAVPPQEVSSRKSGPSPSSVEAPPPYAGDRRVLIAQSQSFTPQRTAPTLLLGNVGSDAKGFNRPARTRTQAETNTERKSNGTRTENEDGNANASGTGAREAAGARISQKPTFATGSS